MNHTAEHEKSLDSELFQNLQTKLNEFEQSNTLQQDQVQQDQAAQEMNVSPHPH